MYDPKVFQALMTNPEFASMTYSEQQAVRDRISRKQVIDDQRFSVLNPAEQQMAYDQIVAKAPPVYENKQFADLYREPTYMQGVVNAVTGGTIVSQGLMWTASKIQGLLKQVGVVPQDMVDPWNSLYGRDASKLTQYVFNNRARLKHSPFIGEGPVESLLGPLEGPQGPARASQIGNIAETVIAVAATKGKGLGIASGLADKLALKGTGFITKGAGKRLMGWAARDWLVKNLGSQVIRSIGAGIVGAERDLAMGAVSQQEWNPGIKATANDIALSFGKYAAMDYLFNVGINTLVPFFRLTWKALFGGRGMASPDLKALAKYGSQEMDELVRRVKIGTMDEAVWGTMPEAVRDTITARAAFEATAANGLDAVIDDPVKLTKSIGYLTNNSVVDAGPGRFRVRRSPGTGGTVIADGVELPEVNRIVAEQYTDYRTLAMRHVEEQGRAVQSAKEVLQAATTDEERLLAKQKLDFHIRALEGSKVTLKAFNEYEKVLGPIANSVERSKAAWIAEVQEGALPITERSALTYGEAAAVASKPGLKTFTFKVDLPEGALSGKEARLIREGQEVRQVREVKDFFVRQSDAFRAQPTAGDFNAMVVYGKPASDRIYQQVLQDVAGVRSTVSVEQLAQARLLSLGYDAVEHADGSLTALLPRSQIKHVSDLIDVKTGRYKAGYDVGGRTAASIRSTSGLSPRFLSSLGKDIHIRQTLKLSVLDKDLVGSEGAMVSMLKSVYGDVKPSVVQKFSRLFLQRYGDDAADVIVRAADIKPSAMTFAAEQGKRVLTVPSRISTTQEQFDFIHRVGELLSAEKREAVIEPFKKEVARQVLGAMGSTKELPMADLQKAFEGQVETAINRYPGTIAEAAGVKARSIYTSPLPEASEVAKRTWLGDALARVKGVEMVVEEGATTLKFAGGTTFTSNNVDDLIDELLVQHTTASHVRYDLAEEGYRLIGTPQKGYKVYDGKTVVGQGATIPELLHTMNWRPAKIDSRFAPMAVEVGDDVTTFTVKGSYAIGNFNDAKRFLDRFVDVSTLEGRRIIINTAEGKIAYTVGEMYNLDMPKWGVHRQFKSAMETRQFMEGLQQNMMEIERLANERGFILRADAKGYRLIDERGTYHAATKADIGRILATKPDPSFAPNLIPEVSEADVARFNQDWRAAYSPQVWALPADFKVKPLGMTAVSQTYRPMHDWLVSYAKKSGHYRLAEIVDAMQTTLPEALRQANETRRLLLYHLFDKTKRGTRLFSDDVLRGLQEWMEAVDDDTRTMIVKDYGLKPHHIEGVKAIRDLLGTDPMHNPGLFGKAGIDSNRFLFDYMPIIRERALKAGDLTDSQSREFLNGIWQGGSLPKEIRFMAEEERLSEVVNMARETNLAKTLTNYSNRLHKKLFLGDLWRQLDDYIKNSPIPVDEVAVENLHHYREMLLGTYDDGITKKLNHFTTDTARRLGSKHPEVAEGFMDMVYTTNALTTQAYRPWLTVRNMTQMYATTGALIGNEWVEAGMKRVLDNVEGSLGVLRERGVITEAPPLINEIAKGETRVGKAIGTVTEIGMKPFKRSDDLSRAVAYFGAEEKWNYFERAMKGVKGPSFIETVGVNLMHDDTAAKVAALLADGSPEAITSAKHLFCNDINKLSMFDYYRPNNARMSHGFLGRMFGQYQVYPVYYANLIRHMMTHGTAGQRIVSIGRLGLNAMAIAGALQLIGIDGKNFLPWVPAQVSGGPMFNLALTALAATNTTSYKGRQARGELKGILLNLIPGSYEFRAVSQALKQLEAGQPLLAFYALTGAPVRPDLRQ